MDATPLPYSLANDPLPTLAIFASFLLMTYALSRGKKHLWQQIANLFSQKKRKIEFCETQGADSRHRAALILASAVLSAILVMKLFADKENFHSTACMPNPLMLPAFILAVIAFFAIKTAAYSLVNWTFFQKEQQNAWINTYLNICSAASFVLLPFVLIAVYAHLNPIALLCLSAFLLVFAKILLFYQCVKNFFFHFKASFHLILYFCTLEIIPLLLMYEGMGILNDLMTLKY